MIESYIDLLSWACKEATEFSMIWRDEVDYNRSAYEFEKSLLAFLIKEDRVDKWPGTELIEKSATLRLYRVCDESIDILKYVKNVFYFVGPNYPEDLAFYANGKTLFASVAHEEIAWFED